MLELVERYLSLKTGVKHNTLANYKFVVNVLKKEEFAYKKVDDVKLCDDKDFSDKTTKEMVEDIVHPFHQRCFKTCFSNGCG